MFKVIVTVLKPHSHEGKWRLKGETYSIVRKYAILLQLIGKVDISGHAACGHGSLSAGDAANVDCDAEKPADAASDPEIEDEAAMAAASAKYEEVYKKKPHHKMKLAGILQAIEKKA